MGIFSKRSSNQLPMVRVPHFIDGKISYGTSTSASEVFDPSKGEIIRTVGVANTADVAEAVQAAERAFPAWAALPAINRANFLSAFRDRLIRYKDVLAATISEEVGKTLPNAHAELVRGIQMVEFAASAATTIQEASPTKKKDGIESWSSREPLGVCVGITPFNFPAMVPLWMFPIAIATGNTFVLKPSEKVPSLPVRLAELLNDAGVPPGVLNVVHGKAETTRALIAQPGVQAVSFVGSTPVAKHIYELASSHHLRVQALGSAKNHLVVMPDAAIDEVCDRLIGAAYGSAGERCMAVAVAVVVGDIADTFVSSLAERVRGITVGPALTEKKGIGPLITREHLDRTRRYIADGVQEGAQLLVDGRRTKVAGHEKGFFLGPSLFDHVAANMRIYKEEIFGPVLCVVRVDTFEEALRLINTHEYANAAAIYTKDTAVAHEFARRAQVGMVGINVAVPVPDASHSFGGWRQSLFGDIAMYGPEGVRFYTQLKTTTAYRPRS